MLSRRSRCSNSAASPSSNPRSQSCSDSPASTVSMRRCDGRRAARAARSSGVIGDSVMVRLLGWLWTWRDTLALRNAKVSRQVHNQPRRRTMTESPMTPELRAALAALRPSQRRMLTVLAGESEHDWLRGLLLGLAAELEHLERRESIAKLGEAAVLHAHYLDHLADVDKAAEGAVWHTEPED